ncbi:hypothetical protein F511_10637 [Dorcoceras hygrometricum]|uniref:Uncharacterized protein n=1 Tax=Dorcoceras hygrometricum TaxID=472368 RepID=A0A2Z7CHM4_9LAMI|nr:hypothetical protein F511_10637 [Dorcoceras hygrometricum]
MKSLITGRICLGRFLSIEEICYALTEEKKIVSLLNNELLVQEKGADDSSSAVILNSRIAALDQFISKLQVKNKLRERECDDAKNQLRRKEEEVSRLRAKLAAVEGKEETSEEEINCKVNERTQLLRNELDRKIQDCQKMANELERRKMEQRMFQQQQEVEMLKRRLEGIESELRQSRAGCASVEIEDNSFMKRTAGLRKEGTETTTGIGYAKRRNTTAKE